MKQEFAFDLLNNIFLSDISTVRNINLHLHTLECMITGGETMLFFDRIKNEQSQCWEMSKTVNKEKLIFFFND